MDSIHGFLVYGVALLALAFGGALARTPGSRTGIYVAVVALGVLGPGGAAQDVPQSVAASWARFDPVAEPLETELIRESTADGIVERHVRIVVRRA